MVLEHEQVPSPNKEQRQLSLVEIFAVIPATILTVEGLLIVAVIVSFPNSGLIWSLTIGAIVIAFATSFILFMITRRRIKTSSSPALGMAIRGMVIAAIGLFLGFAGLILLSNSAGNLWLVTLGFICLIASMILIAFGQAALKAAYPFIRVERHLKDQRIKN